MKSTGILEDIYSYQKTFKEEPFNEVDGFLLGVLSYVAFEKFLTPNKKEYSLEEVYTYASLYTYPYMAKRKEHELELLKGFCLSRRYSKMKIVDPCSIFSYEHEEQFFAITFICEDFIYVSFRGTDATTLGWKEDLNLCLFKELPSQTDSVNYLLNEMKEYSNIPFKIGGHSKGGNLAVYAACHIDSLYQMRISDVYSLDGPGFKEDFYIEEGYLAIAHKITKIVPEASIIGMLLYNDMNYLVIKAMKSGIVQHDPFYWIIVNHHFIYVNSMKKNTMKLDKSINRFISNLPLDRRKAFCDVFYKVLCDLDIVEFKDAKYNMLMFASAIKKIGPSLSSLTEEEKETIKEILKTGLYSFITK